jgi:RND family efflux transporter MFP subunit
LSQPSVAWSVAVRSGLAGIITFLGGCSDESSSRDERTGPTPFVEALPARQGGLPLEERLSGVVYAQNQVTIRPEIAAPILEVLVRTGERVERDQPLVRLQDDTLKDQLRQSEAAVRLAEASAAEARARVAELEAQAARSRRLAEEELISDLELEMELARLDGARAAAAQTEAQVDHARATVEERRSAVRKATVRAPVAGRVGRRDAEVGMLSDPGSALFILGNLDQLTIEVPISERMLAYIREGQPVLLTAPALGDSAYPAELSRISPFLAEGSFSTTGEIDVANPEDRLRPGMFVTVDILHGRSQQATLVPATALWEDPQTSRRGVFAVRMPEGATAENVGGEGVDVVHEVAFREVEVIAEGLGQAGVRQVEAGEWVVTAGQHLLRTDEIGEARVRPTSWDRVLRLQALQREDLLREYLAEQEAWARERGAEPPDNSEFMRGGRNGAEAPASDDGAASADGR